MNKRYLGGELYPRCCSRCGAPKAWADFTAHGKGTRRRRAECRTCTARAVKEWNQVNPGRLAEATKRCHRAWNDASKARAVNDGKEWTSTELEVVDNRRRSARDVARVLGRTLNAVKHARRRIDAEDPRTLYLLGQNGGYMDAQHDPARPA